MSSMKGGVQYIGPFTLNNGEYWVYDHQQGHKAVCLHVLDEDGQPVDPSQAKATQPSDSQIIVVNSSGGPLTTTLRCEWDVYSVLAAANLPGDVGVITTP